MKKLNILGYTYILTTDTPLESMNGNIGYCDFNKQTIDIADNIAQQAKQSTVLHEVIEALNYHLEIGLSEAQIKQIEVGLHQVMSDAGISLNPLFEDLKELYGRDSGKSSGTVLLKTKDSA
jgi:hypothetical protein